MPRFDQAEIVRSSTHAAYLLQAAMKKAFAKRLNELDEKMDASRISS